MKLFKFQAFFSFIIGFPWETITEIKSTISTAAYLYDNFKHIVEISAAAGTGIDELNQQISAVLRLNDTIISGAMLANERQYHCVLQAEKHLMEAQEAIQMGFTMDAVDINIESAISVLLELTGEKVTDAVVNEVFSHFCVGK